MAQLALESLGETGPGPSAAELALWHRWCERQDPRAREALLEQHLPYAKVIAAMLYARRPNNTVEFDDYLQLARMGMLEAFDRYNPSAGAQFRTFAARRMRGAVLDGLARSSEQSQQVAFRRRLLADRAASLAEPANADGTAAGEAMPPGDAAAMPVPELFRYLAEIGVGLALGFLLEDTGMFDAGALGAHGGSGRDPLYSAVELRHTRQQLRQLVRQLAAQESQVITLHYLQGHAFEDIAQQMGLSKGRISQIHKKALAGLRTWLSDRHPCDSLG